MASKVITIKKYHIWQYVILLVFWLDLKHLRIIVLITPKWLILVSSLKQDDFGVQTLAF